MSRALSRKEIPLTGGLEPLHAFLKQYRAEYMRESSTEQGHVYWSAPVSQWLLVMRKGNKAIITFHAADDCPCKML